MILFLSGLLQPPLKLATLGNAQEALIIITMLGQQPTFSGRPFAFFPLCS